MKLENISIIIPGHNNLRHMKNAYVSIRKFYPDVKIIMMDDGSTDGTFMWLEDCVKEDDNLTIYKSKNRVGHTILYDKGIEISDTDIVGILHADMIVGPNYLENLLKHLEKGKVVCATRIEPPLHPPGNEKIIQNFGLDFDDLNIQGFEDFAIKTQKENKGKTTKGMFAPWILYKEDFQRIGGHDPLFAPFPYEDSDIFQRWILAGYELIQSRDSFVYHLTCRGHRWTEKIGENDNNFKIFEERSRRNYIRKWGSWISNDSYQHPIIHPKYDIQFRIFNCKFELLKELEPWCSSIYVDLYESVVNDYIKEEQSNTLINLSDKINQTINSDIVVRIDGNKFTHDDFKLIQHLQKIIQDSGEIGKFEIGNMEIVIDKIENNINKLIFI
jgi:GT2 family glycosyltransferase